MAIRIAVDAMGGDAAPGVVVEGAVQAARAHPERLRILLFGREEAVRTELARHDVAGLAIDVVDAPEVIGMAEAPATAVKTKRQSSIHLGLGAHKQGHADAFISAGNTGAIMAASLFILGRLPNVARPAVIGFFPTTTSYCIVLDIGTNVDCRPEHLVQFARMGAIYARHVARRENPSVGLVNIGEEPGKGNEQVKAAFEMLRAEEGLNFRGNIEGRDILHHAADVVVCDGFVGNVMLKLGESVATALVQMVGAEMAAQGLSDSERALVARVLGGVKRRFDYEEYGGATLLGVDGNVLIGHGGSTARAIKRMIETAVDVVEHNVRDSIASAFGARGESS
ncbi:MAG TPA: phosphate acyltransferase PlsX [Rhodothermales bacterium]